LSNIPTTITVNDIKKEFENYSNIGKCFIDMDRNTGKYKNTGIVEILDTDIYDKFLNIETILINDLPISVEKYENNIVNKYNNNHINNL
jgi:RNA recognition motif-containing protein